MEFYGGIRAVILRSKNTAANGGLSDRFEQVTLVGAVNGTAVPEVRPVADYAPAVIVERGSVGGYGPALSPAEPADGSRGTGYMASGAYVVPVDSESGDAWFRVFGHRNPLPLHDRTESWEQYRLASD